METHDVRSIAEAGQDTQDRPADAFDAARAREKLKAVEIAKKQLADRLRATEREVEMWEWWVGVCEEHAAIADEFERLNARKDALQRDIRDGAARYSDMEALVAVPMSIKRTRGTDPSELR